MNLTQTQSSSVSSTANPPKDIEEPYSRQSTTFALLEPLNHLQSLSQNLLLSLGSPIQSKLPPPPPISAFLQCDENLAAAIQLAQVHQIKQKKIESLKDDLLALQAKWREICLGMEDGKRDLEVLIKEGEERISAIHDAQLASLPYPELLAYAQSLSAFTSAPPNMPDSTLPGQPPPPLFFPPFPNEEKMRRGRLNSEAPLGIAGEAHSVGRPPTASPKIPATNAPQQRTGTTTTYRPDFRPQQQFFDLDLDLNPDL